MASSWFLVADTGSAVHVHAVDGDPTLHVPARVGVDQNDDVDRQVTQMRTRAGVPQDWMNTRGFSVMMAPGVPHPHVLARIEVDGRGVPVCEDCYRQPTEDANLKSTRGLP